MVSVQSWQLKYTSKVVSRLAKRQVQRRSRSAVAQGGIQFAQPLQMAAGSDNAAGKLPVAMISSLLDTVVVTAAAVTTSGAAWAAARSVARVAVARV